MSEVRIAQYPFCHSKKGLRAWDESDVRRFLRTTFYNHLSDGFKSAIVNVNIPFADMNGSPKTVNDNFFLLSIVEWGLSDRINNGSVIKYNNIPGLYKTIIMWYSDNSIRLSSNIGSLTRTINRPEAKSAGYDRDVFDVLDGVLTTHWVGGNWNIRPAVNMKSSTKVSGPYEFKSKYDKMIYYALEF